MPVLESEGFFSGVEALWPAEEVVLVDELPPPDPEGPVPSGTVTELEPVDREVDRVIEELVVELVPENVPEFVPELPPPIVDDTPLVVEFVKVGPDDRSVLSDVEPPVGPPATIVELVMREVLLLETPVERRVDWAEVLVEVVEDGDVVVDEELDEPGSAVLE